MKKYLFGITLVAAAAVIAFLLRQREFGLDDLQGLYAFAKTDAQKNAIVEKLEKYYLNLQVPDTLRQRVEREVAKILDTTKINISFEIVPDTNIYQSEARLQSLLNSAMIARARADQQTSEMIMKQSAVMAKTVDAGKGTNYWTPFAGQMNGFTPEQAICWLKAKKADQLCRSYQDYAFSDAEGYGVLGLKLLQQTPDERTRLNILQCLQYILYEYRSMYDLSLALGEKALQQAEKIKHPHRATSIIYHLAQAYSILGENQKALSLYEAVLENVKKFRQISGIDWYIVPALLGKGERLLDLGDFDEALLTSEKVKKLALEPINKIRLQILRWYIHLNWGNYESAENELKTAMQFSVAAKDTSYIIRCLNNFGFMFIRMGEYDLALDYYNQARSLFRPLIPGLNLRMLILNNMASVLAARNDTVGFEQITREARNLLNATHVPFEEAKSLHILAYMYKTAQNHHEAIKYLKKADSIYKSHGLLRFNLDIKNDLIDCLIALSRLDEAKEMAAEFESLARENDDIVRTIDAINQTARIEYRQGNLHQAINSSNQLLYNIDAVITRFNNPDRLRIYRHKIYNYLKDAALYESSRQRYDSAFIKLERAKALVIKNEMLNHETNHSKPSVPPKYVNLDSVRSHLNEHASVVHYMVMDDTLYIFLLNHSGLRFFSKPVNKKSLQAMVAAYRDSISQTIKVFQRYNPERANLHYAGTARISQQLYQELFDWPELDALIQKSEMLYIVPDEFLYEVPFVTLIRARADYQSLLATRTSVIMIPNAGFLQSNNRVHISNQFKTKRALISIDSTFKRTEPMMRTIRKIFPLAEELMMNTSGYTKSDVLKKLQENYQIYVFIGHGAANPNYPERSYIELTVKMPNTSASKRIRLALEDLNQINWLGAEMVMLVGCETAAGKLYRGTGIHGLYQGFLSLGAQNVLGNLWKVDAGQTMAQAASFLTAWATSSNPARALQACQHQAIEELANSVYYRHPHPYFWGSLTLFSTQNQ
jgi:CHAT domain-containing protein